MHEDNINIPGVNVLISVFNGVEFINQSLKAIRLQSYKNIHLVIIDDGSTDGSSDMLKKYLSKKDKYIKISENTGLINALNEGLKHCNEKYILRTDIDDICHPFLVEELVRFMQENNDYVACGANMIQFPQYSEFIYPEFNYELKAVTLYKAPFSHSCVMINRELAAEELYYSNDMKSVEDFDLWTRLISKGKFYNLQKFLLFYRVSNNQITKHTNYQIERKNGLFKVYYNFSLNNLKLNPELSKLYALIILNLECDKNFISIKIILKLYKRICSEFYNIDFFEKTNWKKVILNKFVFYLLDMNLFELMKYAYLSPNLVLRVLKIKIFNPVM